jgi:hypothetical protein
LSSNVGKGRLKPFCGMTIDSEAGLSGYSPTASSRSVVKIAHD